MRYSFSQTTNSIITESREIAINLGYDYISTIHFFLADCNINNDQSIKDFVFNSQEDLNRFYTSQKKGDSTIFLDTLPLTLEAEHTIKRSIKLTKTSYQDKDVQPHHLFLAAVQLKNTLIYSILQPKEGLFERLEMYYVKKGLINKSIAGKTFWERLFK